MKALHLVPAYGRDYGSKKSVIADWESEKDFLICDITHPDDGRYINRQQTKPYDTIVVRYDKLQRQCVFQSWRER